MIAVTIRTMPISPNVNLNTYLNPKPRFSYNRLPIVATTTLTNTIRSSPRHDFLEPIRQEDIRKPRKT